MDAKRLAEKLTHMSDEYKAKAEDKSHDIFDRSFDAGIAMGLLSANKELLENILKGDIH